METNPSSHVTFEVYNLMGHALPTITGEILEYRGVPHKVDTNLFLRLVDIRPRGGGPTITAYVKMLSPVL